MAVRTSNGYPFIVLTPVDVTRSGIGAEVYAGTDPASIIDVLPDTRNRRWLDELNGAGSGSFEIRADNSHLAAEPTALNYGNIVRLKLDKTTRYAFTIEKKSRKIVTAGEHAGTWITVSGRGVLARLEDAELYPAGGIGGTSPRPFDANAGAIMTTIAAEAIARAALPGITLNFDGSLDSNNAPFLETVTVEETVGTDYLRLANRHAELAVDLYMSPTLVLNYYNTRGIDRSIQTPAAGPIVLRPGLNIIEEENDQDGIIKNVLLVETPAGYLERVDGASLTAYGRKETFLSLGNTSDGDQITRSADAAFERLANPRDAITAQIADLDEIRPYVDFDVGDWVLAPNAVDELARHRVRSFAVDEDPNGVPRYTVELSTVSYENEARLARWLRAMATGTAGGILSELAEPSSSSQQQTTVAVDSGIADHLAGQLHADELVDLVDVDLTGIAAEDLLTFDAVAGDWVVLARADLDASDLGSGAAPSGRVLAADGSGGVSWVAGGGGGGVVPVWVSQLQERADTPHADDDEFNDDTKTGITELTVTGSATWTELAGVMSCKFNSQSAGDLATALKSLTPSAAPVTVETALRLLTRYETNPSVGICFADGVIATSKVAGMGIIHNGTQGAFRVGRLTGSFTAGTLNANIDDTSLLAATYYLRLIWTAANTFKMAISPDGVSWTSFAMTNISTSITPTHFGLWVSGWTQTFESVATYEYLRVTEADLSV